MRLGLLKTCITALFVVSSQPSFADFKGEVIRILDGDTIEVLQYKKPVRIRLADIDAPEGGQSFGSVARQFLADMVFRKNVLVKENSLDRYGRLLAVIELKRCEPHNGCSMINVNHEMVRAGYAWAYRYRGTATSQPILTLENDARKAGRGLWADPLATEPWKWRRKKNNNN